MLIWCVSPSCGLQGRLGVTNQRRSKPDNLQCLRTPKLHELIQSWSHPKCWISSNLPLFSWGIELTWTAGTFMPGTFKIFSFFKYGTELIQRVGTFILVKFKFAPFHQQNWIYQHTHAEAHIHTETHTHTHTHACTHACTHTYTHTHTHTHTNTHTHTHTHTHY